MAAERCNRVERILEALACGGAHVAPQGTAASNTFFEVYPPLPVRAKPNDKRMLPLSFPCGTKVHVAAEHNASHTSYSASLSTVMWTAKPGVPSYVILFARCNQQEVRDALAADPRVALQESEESLVNFCQFAMWNSSQQELLRKWRALTPNCEIMLKCLHNFVPMFGQPTTLSRNASCTHSATFRFNARRRRRRRRCRRCRRQLRQ